MMKKQNTGAAAVQAEGAYHYLQIQRTQVLLLTGKPDEAEILMEKGRDFFAEWDRERGGSYRASEFKEKLAQIAMAKGDYEKAEGLCRRVLERAVAHRGEEYKETLYRRERLADCYAALGKRAQAREEYERVLLILLREYPFQEDWIRKLWEKVSDC